MSVQPFGPRVEGAFTTPMAAEEIAPDLWRVYSTVETYTVDMRDGVCDCEDYRRNEPPMCKHAVFVTLVESER